MFIDLISYLLGKKRGKSDVILETADYTFTDDGEGNITITANASEEETDNG